MAHATSGASGSPLGNGSTAHFLFLFSVFFGGGVSNFIHYVSVGLCVGLIPEYADRHTQHNHAEARARHRSLFLFLSTVFP